jgi:hypothetical protein
MVFAGNYGWAYQRDTPKSTVCQLRVVLAGAL